MSPGLVTSWKASSSLLSTGSSSLFCFRFMLMIPCQSALVLARDITALSSAPVGDSHHQHWAAWEGEAEKR